MSEIELQKISLSHLQKQIACSIPSTSVLELLLPSKNHLQQSTAMELTGLVAGMISHWSMLYTTVYGLVYQHTA